jgi:hypothetical protein
MALPSGPAGRGILCPSLDQAPGVMPPRSLCYRSCRGAGPRNLSRGHDLVRPVGHEHPAYRHHGQRRQEAPQPDRGSARRALESVALALVLVLPPAVAPNGISCLISRHTRLGLCDIDSEPQCLCSRAGSHFGSDGCAAQLLRGGEPVIAVHK